MQDYRANLIPRATIHYVDEVLSNHLARNFPVEFMSTSLNIRTAAQAADFVEYFTTNRQLKVTPKNLLNDGCPQIFVIETRNDPEPQADGNKDVLPAKAPKSITIQANTGKVVVNKTFELKDGVTRIKIGTIRACDLIIDDVSVSRMHAIIEINPKGEVNITDLGSYHGTFVDGRRAIKEEITFRSIVRLGTAYLKITPSGQTGPA